MLRIVFGRTGSRVWVFAGPQALAGIPVASPARVLAPDSGGTRGDARAGGLPGGGPGFEQE